MSKRDELMKYLSLTPWNTNPAILNEKIDEIVKEEGSVNAGNVIQPVNLRPGACRILCGHHEVAAVRKVCAHDIEGAVVIAKCRGHHTADAAVCFHMKCVLRSDRVPDLRPVNEITAVENRYARVKLKTGAGNIVIVTDTADAGIRIKTGNDRVFQF